MQFFCISMYLKSNTWFNKATRWEMTPTSRFANLKKIRRGGKHDFQKTENSSGGSERVDE